MVVGLGLHGVGRAACETLAELRLCSLYFQNLCLACASRCLVVSESFVCVEDGFGGYIDGIIGR
jgi:hypothetical protein